MKRVICLLIGLSVYASSALADLNCGELKFRDGSLDGGAPTQLSILMYGATPIAVRFTTDNYKEKIETEDLTRKNATEYENSSGYGVAAFNYNVETRNLTFLGAFSDPENSSNYAVTNCR